MDQRSKEIPSFTHEKRGIPNVKAQGEDEWIEKWKVLGIKPDPIYYRFFSHFMGPDVRFASYNINRSVIEPILNPYRYTDFYSDKNVFDRMIPNGRLPHTVLRNMNGILMDKMYNPMKLANDHDLYSILDKADIGDNLIIKPTVETLGGAGVNLIEKHNGQWRIHGTDEPLSLDYLNRNYPLNFIIQEKLEQSDFMKQFNPSSINTMRIVVYRSVCDGSLNITNSALRFGVNGSIVDNAISGGGLINIKSNGELGDVIIAEECLKKQEFNGINIAKKYIIPNFEAVKDFALDIASQILHHHIIALDIMLDQDNKPRLIEANTKWLSLDVTQTTHGPVFGDFTDEIIEYCRTRTDRAEIVKHF